LKIDNKFLINRRVYLSTSSRLKCSKRCYTAQKGAKLLKKGAKLLKKVLNCSKEYLNNLMNVSI
jgi:hypothetical protein